MKDKIIQPLNATFEQLAKALVKGNSKPKKQLSTKEREKRAKFVLKLEATKKIATKRNK